jgi:NADP-dependent alcohol dehydrogenase
VIEQYLTYPTNAMVQDRFAEAIMQNLIELGPSVFEPNNYQIRANLMWNATQALSGLIGAGVPQDWSTHLIGHELTALYELDHAATLAIVLPRLMATKKQQKRNKLLQYAERVWQLDSNNEEQAIDQAIEHTESFFRSLGMKTRLSEYGVGDDAPERVKQALINNGYLQLGEHRDITPEHAADIVRQCI